MKKQSDIKKGVIVAIFVILVVYALFKLFSGSDVVAEVNGKEITREQVDSMTVKLKDTLPGADGKTILKQLVANQLLLEEVAKRNIEIDEIELADYFTKTVQGVSVDELAKSKQMSTEDFKAEVKNELALLELFNLVTSTIEVTDEEAYKLFEEGSNNLGDVIVNVSHILVKDESKAEELLARLKKGESFAEIAKIESIDGSAAKGGSLGFFPKGVMVKEFEDAAFSLNNTGEISGIVKTQFGYHILKLNGRISDKQPIFELFKEGIKQSMLNQKKTEVLNAYITDLIKNADIKYYKEFTE